MKGKKTLLIYFVSVYDGPGTVKESYKGREWEKEVCSINCEVCEAYDLVLVPTSQVSIFVFLGFCFELQLRFIKRMLNNI